jgi:crossover junction endodeoxyribonuclease RuvC
LADSSDIRRVIGIDPGSIFLGYAVVEIQSKQRRVLDLGVLNMKSLRSAHLRMKYIFDNVSDLIQQHSPHEMAIEAPFFGKNVQSMLKLGRAQGVAIAAALNADIRIHEYSPKKIKQAITGNGNASKEQVAAMLPNLIEVDLSKHGLDATDALATAICHINQVNGLFGAKQYKDWGAFIQNNKDRIKRS